MLLPNQEHPPRSDYESSGYESKASYLISTSNHNILRSILMCARLLLISFLHQTTTHDRAGMNEYHCFLSHFYIKPQLRWLYVHGSSYCFLSHFYIKPQHGQAEKQHKFIASYLISTSNHNTPNDTLLTGALLLISFLHQTTTIFGILTTWIVLLLISFLHQTTTCR